ncbi:hypothetical protein CRG98_040284 [Punica granatum]|uniref:Uncharacterized protein n=1 Tax=Punica granatum TaxID=22663 RepID=A0A2I0I5S2_PUNGR|nr:hypothetical protein CRG98_040284 [Punica granatum]
MAPKRSFSDDPPSASSEREVEEEAQEDEEEEDDEEEEEEDQEEEQKKQQLQSSDSETESEPGPDRAVKQNDKPVPWEPAERKKRVLSRGNTVQSKDGHRWNCPVKEPSPHLTGPLQTQTMFMCFAAFKFF